MMSYRCVGGRASSHFRGDFRHAISREFGFVDCELNIEIEDRRGLNAIDSRDACYLRERTGVTG